MIKKIEKKRVNKTLLLLFFKIGVSKSRGNIIYLFYFQIVDTNLW